MIPAKSISLDEVIVTNDGWKFRSSFSYLSKRYEDECFSYYCHFLFIAMEHNSLWEYIIKTIINEYSKPNFKQSSLYVNSLSICQETQSVQMTLLKNVLSFEYTSDKLFYTTYISIIIRTFIVNLKCNIYFKHH